MSFKPLKTISPAALSKLIKFLVILSIILEAVRRVLEELGIEGF